MTGSGKTPQMEPHTSPFGRKLLADLRGAGDTGLSREILRIDGVEKELKNLAKLGFAVYLGDSFFLSKEIYEKHAVAILRDRIAGDEITISSARQNTGLSRKLLLLILNRMERDGMVKREGAVRIVLD
jgi:selenocysteine-specific elongation factor